MIESLISGCVSFSELKEETLPFFVEEDMEEDEIDAFFAKFESAMTLKESGGGSGDGRGGEALDRDGSQDRSPDPTKKGSKLGTRTRVDWQLKRLKKRKHQL
jgi:hypothetical protein